MLAALAHFANDLFSFLLNLPALILQSILMPLAGMINNIPVPDFLTTGLSGYLGSMPSSVLYFVTMMHMPEAALIVGAGVTFRLLRKLFTLGQW